MDAIDRYINPASSVPRFRGAAPVIVASLIMTIFSVGFGATPAAACTCDRLPDPIDWGRSIEKADGAFVGTVTGVAEVSSQYSSATIYTIDVSVDAKGNLPDEIFVSSTDGSSCSSGWSAGGSAVALVHESDDVLNADPPFFCSPNLGVGDVQAFESGFAGNEPQLGSGVRPPLFGVGPSADATRVGLAAMALIVGVVIFGVGLRKFRLLEVTR